MISRCGILRNVRVLYASHIRYFIVHMQLSASGTSSSQDITFMLICSSARSDRITSNFLSMHIYVTKNPRFIYAFLNLFDICNQGLGIHVTNTFPGYETNIF